MLSIRNHTREKNALFSNTTAKSLCLHLLASMTLYSFWQVLLDFKKVILAKVRTLDRVSNYAYTVKIITLQNVNIHSTTLCKQDLDFINFGTFCPQISTHFLFLSLFPEIHTPPGYRLMFLIITLIISGWIIFIQSIIGLTNYRSLCVLPL